MVGCSLNIVKRVWRDLRQITSAFMDVFNENLVVGGHLEEIEADEAAMKKVLERGECKWFKLNQNGL